MEKLKVLHVLYSGLGGHGNVVFPLLESEFGEKHENSVVFYGVEPVLTGYKESCNTYDIPYHSIQKKAKHYLRAFNEFKRLLIQEKPNAIFIHNSELIVPAARYAKKNSNCRVIYIEHENHASKSFMVRSMSRYAGKNANAVVCLSETYAKTLKTHFGIDVPIHIIPNGVDTEKYKPNSDKKDKERLIIGMASRMIPGKDHPNLLKAFQKILPQYPNAELHIAGDGETLAAIKQLAIALHLQNNVRFLGILDTNEMLTFYSTLSIYVLATKSENLSTALLQSMACEIPTITSDIENNRLIISPNETGWLYKESDAEDLSRQICDCIASLQTNSNIPQQAREKIITNYSSAQLFLKYDLLLTTDKLK